MSKTLHIVHPTFDVSTINNKSILLTVPKDILPNTEYHTSLGDMSAADILSVSKQFELINFIPDTFNSKDPIYYETVILLTYLQHSMKVNNFFVDQIETFIDNLNISSRPADATLWVFGCSHSHGVGLLPNELRYSDIISQELNMPLKSITKPGASTRWSLRHLINSNINPQDLVIWQLTTPDRISLSGKPPTELILSATKNPHLLEVYTDGQIYFDHMSLVNYGVQYLRAKGVRFVITSIQPNSKMSYSYKKEYAKYKEYCYSPNFNVDTGTDNLHFGKISHKNLALSILNHIEYTHG
jgi:hypothetical protein